MPFNFLSQIDASPLIKSWGPWGVILVGIGLLIWKWLIPLANKVIERSQARNDKLIEMIAANLMVSAVTLILALALRRSSLRLAESSSVATRYWRAQGQAWESTAIEIVTALIRATAGFFLPDSIPVIVLLSVGLIGRVYQAVRLVSANTAITNGR